MKVNAGIVFPALPSFIAVAMILSYTGYKKRTTALMESLSKKTSNYLRSHTDILDSFIIDWVPKHTGSIDFKNHSTYNASEVKCPADVESIIRTDRDVRLCAIRYTNVRNQHALTGIQLIFTNGVETPFIETVKSARGWDKPESSSILELFSK